MGKIVDYKRGDIIGNAEYMFNVPRIGRNRRAMFKCKCGAKFECDITSIKSGNTSSCGCIKRMRIRKLNYSHGYKHHPLYGRWKNIKSRCYNKNVNGYKNYGGRGITVSDEFRHDAKAFIDYAMSLDNALVKGYTIDRINNDLGYSRGNLRWASATTQCINQRKRCDSNALFTGVYRNNNRNDFVALLSYNNKITCIGRYFDTQEEAAIARDKYIVKHGFPHRLSGL